MKGHFFMLGGDVKKFIKLGSNTYTERGDFKNKYSAEVRMLPLRIDT